MTSRANLTLAIVLFVACAVGGFAGAYAWQSAPAGVAAGPRDSHPVDALGAWLNLPPAQVADLARVDPAFAEDRAALESDLARERELLAALFDDPRSSNERLREQVEKVIAAHDRCELRVADYLLAIRPHLSDAQRATLFSHCAATVREAGGARWRHGQAERGAPGGAGRGPGAGGGRGRPWGGSRPRPTSAPTSQTQGDSP